MAVAPHASARCPSISSRASNDRWFFSWLLAQPEFLEGRVRTTYPDDVLKARNGQPFVEASPDVEEMAEPMRCVLQAALSGGTLAGRAGDGGESRRWRARARTEGVG